MSWPPNDSPFWSILKLAVVGGILALMLQIGYANGFEPKKDLPTIIAVLSGLGLWDSVAKRVAVSK